MKGINLKKIGAIVAGSAILASSVAFAGLVYQSTPLVDANGQPVVKIVVGEAGQMSDGVVAAYIASKIANEAYKTSTLTAEVVGDGTCTGTEGEGTCTVSNEKVELEITVPGSGAADREEYSAAIGDYLDRELKNRYRSDTDADEAYTVRDDYTDDEADPYMNYIDGYLDTYFDYIEYEAMVRVGSEFGPFAPVTVQPKGGTSAVTEDQYFTFAGYNHWDDGDEELETTLGGAGYVLVFDPSGDYGLPVCPGDEGLSLDLCADTDELPAKKVYIKFLNEDWIISELTPADSTGTTLDQEVYHTDGSTIKLAKEAVSGIINVGEFLDTGTGYKVRLDDISREVGIGNDHPAIITVLDSNDNEICQDQVWPGETEDDLCDSTGVKLHVYQTAPGVMLIAKWAEMGIFSDEIELEDGMEFIEDSDSAWDVLIGWSNKGDNESKSDPEYLRGIYLYTDASDYDEMTPGDSLPVVDLPDYNKFELIYNGIDDEGVEYDDVKYKLETTMKRIEVQNTSGTTCFINTTGITGDNAYVRITSGKSEFRGTPTYPLLASTKRGDELYWLPNGALDETCGFGTLGTDSVLLKDDDGDWWIFDSAALLTPVTLDYRWAGSNGAISFGQIYNDVWLGEDAGKVKSDFMIPGTFVTYTAVDALGIYYDNPTGGPWCTGTGDLVSMNLASTGCDDEEVTLWFTDDSGTGVPSFDLQELGYRSAYNYEAKFVSPRGTQFSSSSSSQKTFKVPKSVLEATYTFATTEALEAEPDVHTLIMGEGDEETVGTTGVKVKVVEITELVSPCTFGTGAGAAPTCDMSGVSAVIMPNNAPTVSAQQMYALTSNMVVLDRDATALDTGTIITVGGDVVNTVTADAIAGSGIDFTAQPVVVRAIGNKIVVAGLSAEDTITAGQQFVAALTRN